MRQRLTFSVLATAGLSVVLVAGCGITSSVSNKVTQIVEKPRRDEETKYSMARLHERNSNIKQAEELLLELHKKYPKKPQYAHRLANIYARMEKFDEADKYYAIAQELSPNNVDIYTDRGYAAMLEGDYAQAERYLRDALERKPNDTRAANNMGMVLAYEGKSDEALKYFRRSTSEAEALCNLAYVHVQRGEGEQAMKRYNQALSIDPNLKVAANGLTQLAEARQRLDQAQQLAGRNKAASEPKAAAPATAPRSPQDVVPVSAQEKSPRASETHRSREPSVPVRRAVKETPVEEESKDAPGRASVKKSAAPAGGWEMPDRMETASGSKARGRTSRPDDVDASATRTAAWKADVQRPAIRPVEYATRPGIDDGFSDPDDEERSDDEPALKSGDAVRKTGASKPWWQD